MELHRKYSEHLIELSQEIGALTRQTKKANEVSLKSLYYLRSSMSQCQKLKNTMAKYETDLKEKRKEELEALERIISISSKKSSVGAKSQSVQKQPKSKTGKEPDSSVIESPEPRKLKDSSNPVTIETHAAALQRRVYVLRNENDQLKLDLHNCQQNYLEVKSQFLALQQFNEGLMRHESSYSKSHRSSE